MEAILLVVIGLVAEVALIFNWFLCFRLCQLRDRVAQHEVEFGEALALIASVVGKVIELRERLNVDCSTIRKEMVN